MLSESLTFQIPEILSLVGLIQCVYILVYMAFRAGDVRFAVLPSLYFIVLGGAFFLDFAYRFLGEYLPHYDVWQWAAWFAGPPLSALLIIQVARVTRLPEGWHYAVLLLLPLAFWVADGVADGESLNDWLVTAGLGAGALSLLLVFAQRGMLDQVRQDREGGRARFWLVMTLLLMNGAFMGVMLVSLGPWLEPAQAMAIRTIIGLGLGYLAGTSLFRIFPQTVKLVAPRGRAEELTGPDRALAERIVLLLDRDKVYQEPTYSRADLARELDVAEMAVSRVINAHFGRSLPQLLNERRVEDARQLLRETDAPVRQVAEDVGFNSMATFNRVFRDQTGQTPTAYRQAHVKGAA